MPSDSIGTIRKKIIDGYKSNPSSLQAELVIQVENSNHEFMQSTLTPN